MFINDTDREYPNFGYGYETAIKMPFHFSRLSNGALTVHDEGQKYDMYSCKGSMVIPPDLLNFVGEFGYTVDNRGGLSFMRDTVAKSFYPFTPAVVGTRVISNGGQVVDYDDSFYVDIEMFMGKNTEGYNIIFAEGRPTIAEGSLEISGGGVLIAGIRHPINGFNPSVAYNAYPRQMLGRRYEAVNYRFLQDYEPQACAMTITAATNVATNIIRALVNNIRADWFHIRTPKNYAVFGRYNDDEVIVRLASGELRVKHVRFDEFEI
jgi:hypothetical protein